MNLSNLTVGVVGSGLMGTGLVQLLMTSEVIEKIYWKSGRSNNLGSRMQDIEIYLDRLLRKNRITEDQFVQFKNKVIACSSYAEMSECNVVHEAVSEDLNIKVEILKALDAYLLPNAIIASNTSSLSITELSFSTSNPHRCVGMHFFNPATIMKLVEIIPGIATSADIKEYLTLYAEALGKTAVQVEEAPGFIVNRLLIPMINEAICIFAEHLATKEAIDIAMKLGANHPIGPLALADMIGNDVVLSIMEVLYKETGDQKYRPHPYLRKIVRAGNLGKKSKIGFYEYK